MEYVTFKNDEFRNKFFDNLRRFSKLKWKELSIKTKIPRNSLGGYKRGQPKIPKKRFLILLDYLPNNFREDILNNIKIIDSNYWLKKGGKNAYKINIKKFEKGRKKGISSIKKFWEDGGKIYKKRVKIINVSFDLSKELCEVIGAFIGDGFFNCYKNKLYQIEFAGDSKKDLEYYSTIIIPTIKLFVPDVNPHIYYVKNKNSIRIVFYSKKLFYFLKKGFGFVPGKKTHTICIPKKIMDSDKEFINATIRGIFDTDGCIFLDKRKTYIKPYPRISIQTVSKSLYMQLKDYLSKYFKLYTAEFKKRNIYCIEIYGHNQLNKWMNKIGFSNKRHLNRLPR